jgi:hypothetical protein
MIPYLALAKLLGARYTLARSECVSDKDIGHFPMYALSILSKMAHQPCS